MSSFFIGPYFLKIAFSCPTANFQQYDFNCDKDRINTYQFLSSRCSYLSFLSRLKPYLLEICLSNVFVKQLNAIFKKYERIKTGGIQIKNISKACFQFDFGPIILQSCVFLQLLICFNEIP